ncbi:MAG: dihydroorotase [Flavobacteriales bacterium]|nr:dihydroorotase [Flavobacteriales bacterium]
MQILIRAAKIIDPTSEHNGKIVDVLITDGVFTTIGKNLDSEGIDEVIEGDDLHISTGWVDLYATFGDPGKEYKEDIESGLNTAAQGGFTKVAISPQTDPVVDSKSDIRYLLKKAENHVVDALPIGAITKGLKGQEMAEMFDMQTSGAVAVSNGKHTIANTKLQNLALLYSKNLNVAFYTFCQDELLASGGQMHEGQMNTSIGLKGIPALAEEVAVARDLYLAEYSDVAVHFSHITTKSSVDLIRSAKAKELKVTASVPAHHLSLKDEAIADFDPNYKVVPPFRNSEHIEALIAGVADGTIDSIISDHEPCEIEAKFSEFSVAEAGIIALETAFSTALEALSGKMKLEEIIKTFTTGPRKVLNLQTPTIKEGNEAEITIFTPTLKWIYEKKDIKSLSSNSPLIGKEMTGLPVGIVNKGQLYLNS